MKICIDSGHNYTKAKAFVRRKCYSFPAIWNLFARALCRLKAATIKLQGMSSGGTCPPRSWI